MKYSLVFFFLLGAAFGQAKKTFPYEDSGLAAALPGSCALPSFYFATDTNALYACNGTTFVLIIGSGGGVVGPPTNGSQVIGNGTQYVPQTKPVIDVRDYGVDCSGNLASASANDAALAALTATPDFITGATLIFPPSPGGNVCFVAHKNTWFIANQSSFVIDFMGRGGQTSSAGILYCVAGGTCTGGPQIDMNHTQGFEIRGGYIDAHGLAAIGLNIDKSGSGRITSDGRIHDMQINALGNQTWTGIYFSATTNSNNEDMRVDDTSFGCNLNPGTTQIGIHEGPNQNGKNYNFRHNFYTNCLYGVYWENGSVQILDSEFRANGGVCGSGSGADIRIDADTDPIVVRGNLDEIGTQFINCDNDSAACNISNGITVEVNHSAPGGCQNAANYWFDTPAGVWTFSGNTWDALSTNYNRIIGTNATPGAATIFTKGATYPNQTFNPWWTQTGSATNVFGASEDVGVMIGGRLFAPSAQTGTYPSSGNAPSPLFVFRGYLAGSTSTPDDFTLQAVPGKDSSSGSTFVIKHQQGTTGTSMFAFDGSYPGLNLAQVPTVGAPAITVNGTSGGTSYTYSVVAFYGSLSTPGSATTATGTGNATLSSTNFNQIVWSPVPGATKYCVWLTATTGGANLGNIGCTSAVMNINIPLAFTGYTTNEKVQGQSYFLNHTSNAAGDSAALPTLNASGAVQLASVTFANLPASANGTMFYCSDCKNVTDDTTGTFDSAAASGGHGTNVLRENGAWRVH